MYEHATLVELVQFLFPGLPDWQRLTLAPLAAMVPDWTGVPTVHVCPWDTHGVSAAILQAAAAQADAVIPKQATTATAICTSCFLFMFLLCLLSYL